MKKTLAFLTLLVFGWTCTAAAGTKEEIVRLQQDVLQLQQLIRQMQESQDQVNGVLKSLLEQLNDQSATTTTALNALADSLRGRNQGQEQVVTELRDAIQQLGVKLDDTNSRIAALQSKVEERQMRAESLRSYSPDVQGGIEPDRVYSAAYNDYIMGNYELAIAAFQDFLSTFPDSEYSDNAAYYLGVCQMQQGRYEAAIQAFDEVLTLYPRADKTTPAYYKKGMAQLAVQRNAEAIDSFRKVITLYPDSQEALLAKQELQRLGIDPEEIGKGRSPRN